MGKRWFFTEQEPAGRQTMLKRNGTNCQRAVFVDNSKLFSINRMEGHLETEMPTEQFNLCMKHRPQFSRCIDMERRHAPLKSEGADHTNQSKAMVAVDMGNKNSLNLVEIDA